MVPALTAQEPAATPVLSVSCTADWIVADTCSVGATVFVPVACVAAKAVEAIINRAAKITCVMRFIIPSSPLKAPVATGSFFGGLGENKSEFPIPGAQFRAWHQRSKIIRLHPACLTCPTLWLPILAPVKVPKGPCTSGAMG